MVAFSTLSLALLTQSVVGLRMGSKASAKMIGGVPILNYRYRHMQVGAMDGKYDWVLKFQDGLNDDNLQAFCGGDAGVGACSAVGHPTKGGAPLATVRATEEELLKMFAEHPSLIEWAEPDTPVELEPTVDEEVSATGNVWGHETIGLTRAAFTGKGVHIYVMDTGIRVSHEDFEGRAVATIDTITGGGRVTECQSGDSRCGGDTHGHGTHVAGTAGGKRFGVAREATLHAMKVCCGSGTNILAGMDWIATKGSQPAVMTMSLGSYSTPESSRVAVDAVVNAGITVTVSAGNRGTPSCDKSYTFIRSAIGVGASDENNQRASFSNYGECNAIFAPGVRTLSASHTSDTGSSSKSGTSMAAPLVAGVTALLLQQDATRTPGKIRDLLRERAQPNALQGLKRGDPNLLVWAGATQAPQPAPAPPPAAEECPFYCALRMCLLDACNDNCDFCRDDTALAEVASNGCKSQSDQDQIARKRSSLSDDVRNVVIGCIGQSQSCVTRGVAQMGFSSSCSQCVGSMGVCAKDNCKWTCTWNGFKSEACKSCTVEYCFDTLVSCSGLPRSQLPDP